jgi:outer membrane lipoprotein SlyB
MTIMNRFSPVLALAALLALSACETMNSQGSVVGQDAGYPQSTTSGGAYSWHGVVQSIELVRQDVAGGSSGIGIGTIAGAVVGGIVGNQIGSGGANTAATVVGAAGGAYVGHELEKRNHPQADAYRFTIRLNNGSYQTVTQNTNPDIRVGDRVQIDNGVLRRY